MSWAPTVWCDNSVTPKDRGTPERTELKTGRSMPESNTLIAAITTAFVNCQPATTNHRIPNTSNAANTAHAMSRSEPSFTTRGGMMLRTVRNKPGSTGC